MIDTYKISNLLGYQVEELRKYLKEQTFTLVPNNLAPHFTDAYAGLTETEFEFLSALGFSVRKHVVIGQLAVLNEFEESK
jgi:hypothetical protein